MALSQRPRKDITLDILIWQRKDIKIKRHDYTGNVYGHLEVIEMLYNYKGDGKTWCRCRCECGEECVKDSYELRKNPHPHCGCKKDYYKQIQSSSCRKDLTGLRFGSLVVDKMIYEYKHKTKAECTCDCGEKVCVIATYLTSGDTTSCGCYQKKRTVESNIKDFSGITSNYGVRFIKKVEQNDHGCWLWECECPCCNGRFVALPAKVLNGHITSCGCARQSSRERLIESILKANNISFEREHIFNECRNIHPLRFDFYIESKNTVIEYQGEQHYSPVIVFGGVEEFKIRKHNDDTKRAFCKENNISLIELPYTLSDKEIYDKVLSVINP